MAALLCSQCRTALPRPGPGRRATWCTTCDLAWELGRSKPEAAKRISERFDSKVLKDSDCWIWTGAISDTGYGSFGIGGRTVYAHRYAYEREKGPIPPDLVLDHLCRERACVNPAHLEAVTRKENVRRGKLGVLKTECAMGHPWNEEHIYHRPGSDWQMCGTCNRERARQQRQRLKAGR